MAKARVELPTVSVPELPPMLRVVAAPAKLTVVAVAFIKLKLEEPVVKLVVMSGLVPNTATPVPVSSVRVFARTDDAPEEIKFLEESVRTNLLAVRLGKLTVEAVDEPMFRAVVAPPAKLTVVAVVFIKSKELLPVVKLVVIAGEVPNTATPVPVSSLKVDARTEEAAV